MTHSNLGAYLAGLIGQPWERHGLHCWRIVVKVQKDLFGRTVPFGHKNMVRREDRIGLMSLKAEDYGWREVEQPEHGAVVRMYRVGGIPTDLEHAGVYLALEAGRVLHSDQPHGVVLDTLPQLLNVRGWVPRWFVPDE